MMIFNSFSPKQKLVLNWWCKDSLYNFYDAIICDGAVRSGKTLCMSLSFCLWASANFNNSSFAFCGKTITSLRRNLVTPMINLLKCLGYSCKEKISQSYIDISYLGVTNRFYLFGGNDESSACKIQGVTLAGVLFDEVALMPRSFVEQSLARCSVEGSKFWFNCNPENPFHWFYLEWIKKAKQKNALYLHFLMSDNPSLSKNIIKRYENMYSGAFYDRFVLGKWVRQMGLVYPMFDYDKHTFDEDLRFTKYYVSCDYGTVNPTSMGLWGFNNNTWYRIKEFYYNSRNEGAQKTDEEYYQCLKKLVGKLDITAVIVDPSASSFMECIRRHNEFSVIPAQNDVIGGIRKVSEKLKSNSIKIHTSCKDSIREFGIYVWEDNTSKDIPKKENDHAMDDIRYFVSTVVFDGGCDFFVVNVDR